jgi:hypothetical protein
MSITVNVTPKGIFKHGLKRFRAQYGEGIQRALDKSALTVRNFALRSIERGNRSGRTYEQGKWYGRGGGTGVFKRTNPTHKASAAGEFPKTDTGFLVKNFHIVSGNKLTRTIGVGSRVQYAKWLEQGTRTMRARPYLVPSLEHSRPAIKRFFEQEIIKSARRG